jgi:hypothetical protein
LISHVERVQQIHGSKIFGEVSKSEHGFFCFQTFQALLSEILQVRPVIYTFVLGCGQHSLKQYRVALRKACHEGLREAGLSEDRHASDGAIGKFKSIDDKDCGNPWGVQRCFPIV